MKTMQFPQGTWTQIISIKYLQNKFNNTWERSKSIAKLFLFQNAKMNGLTHTTP